MICHMNNQLSKHMWASVDSCFLYTANTISSLADPVSKTLLPKIASYLGIFIYFTKSKLSCEAIAKDLIAKSAMMHNSCLYICFENMAISFLL